MIPPLLMVLVCLIFAYLASELFKYFGMPRVVGQIIAGIILGIGPIKELVFNTENISVINFLAQLGIILLFYYVGLEMSLKSLTKDTKEAVVISLFKGILPFVLGFAAAKYLFKFDDIASIVAGVSLSAGAQSVSVDLLEEMKLLKSRLGTMIISVGVITDMLELLIVGALFALFEVTIRHATFARFIMYVGIFLLFIVAARFWIIPFLFKFFDREKSSTSRFMGSMVVVLLVVSFAEFLGIGALIGALVAGIIIRQTIFKDITIPNWEEYDIARSIHIIAFGFLIPLFFVWIGINTEISVLVQHHWMILAFVLVSVTGVIGGTMLAIKLTKKNIKTGFILGWGLSPKGDIGFVVGALALEAGVLSQEIFSALVLMALIITIISPIIFRKLILKYDHRKLL